MTINKKRLYGIGRYLTAFLLVLSLCAATAVTSYSAVNERNRTITTGDFVIYTNETAQTAVITDYTGEDAQVTLPATLEGYSITRADFKANAVIEEVTIPAEVPQVTGLSSLNNLSAINVAADHPNYSTNGDGVLYNRSRTIILQYPANKDGEYEFPGSLSAIGSYSFYGCSGLTELTIPASIGYIGIYAFANCRNLESVVIEGNVSTLYWGTFAQCSSLRSLTLPDNISTIMDGSFDGVSPELEINARPNGYVEQYTDDHKMRYNKIIDLSCNSDLEVETLRFGSKLIINAQAPDDAEGYTYSLYYKQPGSTVYMKARGYSSDPVLELRTKGAMLYDVRFKTRNAKGKVINKDFKLNVKYSLMNTSTISNTTPAFGETVTVNLGAYGGHNGYTYKVDYKRASMSTFKFRCDVAEGAESCSFKPAAADTDYVVRVTVTDGRGKTDQKLFNISVGNKLDLEATFSSEEITLGDTITINAQASGGSGSYVYAVYYRREGTHWLTCQKYSENNEILLTPKMATDYEVCVKTKDSNGLMKKNYYTIHVTPALAVGVLPHPVRIM